MKPRIIDVFEIKQVGVEPFGRSMKVVYEGETYSGSQVVVKLDLAEMLGFAKQLEGKLLAIVESGVPS